MTRDDIIRMAREAGLPYMYQTGEIVNLGLVERFAALVAAASASVEREEIADGLENGFFDEEGYHLEYAAAIRAKGEYSVRRKP